jgi:hypothetical protein
MTFPKNMVLLISGIPATGKSTFCRYLSEEHGVAHYDLENPDGWPHPALHKVWERNRSEFVARLTSAHSHVALDWGFPPAHRARVDELKASGVRLVWFDGDLARARAAFESRGGGDPSDFDRQVDPIQRSGLPVGLGARVIRVIPPNGIRMTHRDILDPIVEPAPSST